MALSQRANLTGFTAQPTQKNQSQGGYSRVQVECGILKTAHNPIFLPVTHKRSSDFLHSFKVLKSFETLGDTFPSYLFA